MASPSEDMFSRLPPELIEDVLRSVQFSRPFILTDLSKMNTTFREAARSISQKLVLKRSFFYYVCGRVQGDKASQLQDELEEHGPEVNCLEVPQRCSIKGLYSDPDNAAFPGNLAYVLACKPWKEIRLRSTGTIERAFFWGSLTTLRFLTLDSPSLEPESIYCFLRTFGQLEAMRLTGNVKNELLSNFRRLGERSYYDQLLPGPLQNLTHLDVSRLSHWHRCNFSSVARIPNLRSLAVQEVANCLSSMPYRAPALEKLKIRSGFGLISGYALQDMLRVLPHYSPHLRRLECGSWDEVESDDREETLQWGGFHKLRLDASLLRTLLKESVHLESIVIRQLVGITAQDWTEALQGRDLREIQLRVLSPGLIKVLASMRSLKRVIVEGVQDRKLLEELMRAMASVVSFKELVLLHMAREKKIDKRGLHRAIKQHLRKDQKVFQLSFKQHCKMHLKQD
jgi:hypothetical protein